MFIYILSSVIVVGSVGGILWIVGSKFSQVSLIDVTELPQEKVAQKKKDMMQERVSRHSLAWWNNRLAKMSPKVQSIRSSFRKYYGKILRMDYQHKKKGNAKPLDAQKRKMKVSELMVEAKALVEQEKYGEAERVYVHAVRIDPRNAAVYEELGDLYMAGKEYGRAKETYGFLVKMSVKGVTGDLPKHTDVTVLAKYYIQLAVAAAALGENEEAINGYEMAASLEPSNPRYLDLLLETCILEGDQMRAWEVWEKLRAVNPKNQKLDNLEGQIVEMPE